MSGKNTPKSIKKAGFGGWRISLMDRLRGYFLAGILVTAPISITIYLTWIFLSFIDQRVAQILPPESYANIYRGATIPGLGLLVAVPFFIIVGWFAKNVLGRLIVGISEYIVDRLPVINAVYKAVKQLFETLMGSQAQAFREVVMLEYPRAGTWTLGFVTGVPEGEIQDAVKGEMINVFIPTAPSPVNGFLLFVPRKDTISLKMSVEDGIKMVVTMGLIGPSTKLTDGKGATA